MLLMKYKKKRKFAKKILPGTLYDVQKEKIKMVDSKLETLNAQGTDHIKRHFSFSHSWPYINFVLRLLNGL